MNDVEKIVLDKIDEMRDEIIKFHQKIIQIPSENPPRKYKEIVKFTENKFKELGLKTLVKRNNVVGELGNGNSRTLILNAHLDTVEAFKEQWTKDPADYLLENGIIKGDACLLGDAPCDYPFGYTGGTMYITFTTHGKQAHGLGFPDLPSPYRSKHSGINSIEKMVKIINFLLGLKEEFLKKETKYAQPEGWNAQVSSVNIAVIDGGNKITTVPNKCLMHCSINTIPEQDIESIKTRILNYVEELKKQDPNLNITVQIPIALEPHLVNEDSDFAKAVKNATKAVFKEERDFKLFLPSTDAHWFQERGIPTVLIGCTRGDNNAHAEDEFVYIEDLINTTKMYALTTLNYLK